MAVGEVCSNSISVQLRKQVENAVRNVHNDETIEIRNALKIYWPRKKNRRKCDILLDLNHLTCTGDVQMSETDLEKIAELLCVKRDALTLVQRCELVNADIRQLEIQLERRVVIANVLGMINAMGNKYGQFEKQLENTVLLRAYIKTVGQQIKCCNLTELRTLFICNLIGRIFKFVGCSVEMNSLPLKPGNYLGLNKCGGRSACESHRNACREKLFKTTISKHKLHHMDGAVELEHFLNQHSSKEVDTCLNVACESHFNECHSSYSLWEMLTLYPGRPTAIFIKLGLVTLEDEGESLASHLYEQILEETKRSSINRNNDLDDINGHVENVNETYESLADFSMKLDLLSRLASHTIKRINPEIAVRNGAFVMYNYARICVLLECFEDRIRKNLLPSLPSISEVNFSLLKQEDEWHLVLFCAKYSDLMMEMTDDILQTSVFSCHKLMKYLVELSHSLSVYYNRINILADLGLHHQNILFTRIQLLICIKQLMENIFDLLDVTPIKKM